MATLVVQVVKATELPNEDSGEPPDPYVEVCFRGKTKKTSVRENEANPVWNEKFTFDVRGKIESKDVVTLRIIDKEGLLERNKLIGQATISYRAFHGGKKVHALDMLDKEGKTMKGKLTVETTNNGDKENEGVRLQRASDKDNSENERNDYDEQNFNDEASLPEGAEAKRIKKSTDRSSLSEKVEDFQIRVKIIEGRQLAGSNIKPVVQASCGPNQIRVTRVKKGSSPFWEEMMVFNFKESIKTLYDFLIEFTVNNSKHLRSDAMIGSFKLDVGNVYEQPDHAYVRKWILLTDPGDTSNTPKGYLKITICVLGAGDEPPDDTGKDEYDDDVEGNLLTPAGAPLRSAIFLLRVFKAEDIPQMDTAAFQSMKKFMGIGESDRRQKQLVDPYLVFKFAGKKRKTQIMEQNNNPEWQEELALPIKFPSMCDTLQLTVFDWDRIGSNDAVGTVNIPVSKISSTGEDSESGFLPTFGPTFVNIYGSPREFSEFGDNLDALNMGKSLGCAYRGRIMVELLTKLEEEGADAPQTSQPIEPDIIAASQKYLRRRRFQLVVAFQEASMIEKPDEPIEFEVSMGNYGNKFDRETQASSSTTELTRAIYDGTYFYFLPWGSKKPVVCITSQWEDAVFRYHALNVILRLISTMEGDLENVKKMMLNDHDEVEIASEIVRILNDLLLACTKGVPDPRGRSVANNLDSRLYSQRMQQFAVIRHEAIELRQTCTDANLATAALEDYVARLKEMACEPQSSMPDVIIWMLSGNKRVAYARIPANEVLFSKERQQYCGRLCGKMQNICLKYPTAKLKSKKNYKIACQLQAMIWLGRTSDQGDFNFNSRGQISVYADTYETEVKVPVKGWTQDGFRDRSNEIALPKKSFQCPAGWVWNDDWFISPSTNLQYDASSGFDIYTDEAYEVQYRFPGGSWEEEGFLDNKLDHVQNLGAIESLEGWMWQTEWEIDCNRACDEDGWEYTITTEDPNPVWQTMEKVFHLNRRRRWIRTKKCVDAKLQSKKERDVMANEEGWEYAKTGKSQYHPEPKTLDMVRRRRWLRRMVADDSKGSAAIFNLDCPLVHATDVEGRPISPQPSAGEEISGEKKETEQLLQTSALEVPQSEPRKRKKEKKSKKKGSIPAEGSSTKSKKSTKVPKMPTPRIFLNFDGPICLQLRVYLYQARDLLPMDQDSFSDPFVFASFMNNSEKSELVRHTLNPIWDQTLIMNMDYYGDLDHLRMSCPDVILEIYDKDDIVPINFTGRRSRGNQVEDKHGHVNKGSLEFMGRSFVPPMFKLDPEEAASPRLAWYNVCRGDLAGGSVLAAAELLVKSEDRMMPFLPPRRLEVFKVPPGIRPVLQRTAIEFVIWGVRNMESYKLLSVDRPSVVIQVGDVEVRSRVIKNLKKYPNFSEPTFFLEANLPKEGMYCPPIVIRVKDNRRFGRRPTVGQHIITDLARHIVTPPAAAAEKYEDPKDTDGLDDQSTVIEVIPPSPEEDSFMKRKSNVQEFLYSSNGSIAGDLSETDGKRVDVEEYVESTGSRIREFGKTFIKDIEEYGKIFTDSIQNVKLSEEIPEEEIDWWSKYYASIGDGDKCGEYLESGRDTIKVYKSELEKQDTYNHFSDFIQTFKLFRGKQGEDDDDSPPVVGEFKGAIYMYPLPPDPNDPMPQRLFKSIPSTEPVEVKVRVYVVRAFDLAPQDANGLADPYLKIKVGKKRIVDRKNYLPNTLNPTFGRMFEIDLLLPIEKDLRIELIDWDLIGTDDKIGETVIDLENRYLSKYRAWCGLPATYCCEGTNKWRDQLTPKEWLVERAKSCNQDPPVWNGNTCVLFNGKKYLLDNFEKDKPTSKELGPADERLALYILKTLPHVPEHVETRPLFSDIMPGIEQGRVQLWVDMFPKQHGEPGDPVDITPRTPTEYVMRVIIWNCREIPMMDTSAFNEKMTDIYVKGWIGGLEHKTQKTDVHYRSMDGTGMFNWRFIFPFQYQPQERMVVVSKKEHVWSLDQSTIKIPPVLYLQVWDNDLFGPNEYISEVALPLNKTPKCVKFQRSCTLENLPDLQGNCAVNIVSLFDQKLLNGWWPLYSIEDGEKVQSGKIEMSIEILTKDEHVEKMCAKARDEPNEYPKLQKPKRPSTSFAWFSSPWKSFRYIIWRKYKCIIITIILVLFLFIFLILFIYSFPGAFTDWFMNKI